ncbi:MAG TPA: hypothetical protein VL359_11220, partial [bacterium]|nr:hypothetical protein [bacterium]
MKVQVRSGSVKARWESLPHIARDAPLGWKDFRAQPPLADGDHSATQTVPPARLPLLVRKADREGV